MRVKAILLMAIKENEEQTPRKNLLLFGWWMEKYFNLIGDKMPNSSQVHLPSWETQKDIHARYCQDMNLQGIEQDEVAGLSLFYKTWTEHFSHVVIPEVRLLLVHVAT